MSTTVFDLQAVLGLDSSKYESGLTKAKGMATTFGSGLATAAKVGLAAVGAATTAMVGFGASAVKEGMNFDQAMSQVAATMGKTMDEMNNEVGSTIINVNGKVIDFTGTLRDFALELGKNTKFTATEAAEALNYMALAGYDTQKSMEMLPTVLNLAAAGNMNLARASDMVTDTETAFGLTTQRTALMVDEMAKAASTGNTSVEQLGDAFLQIGGLAQELNGGFIQLANGESVMVDGTQELEIALTAMANAGVKGNEAGTHMRNILLKLASPTEAGTKQLEAMGVSVFDLQGNMRSLADIFGDLSTKMGEMTQEEKLNAIKKLFNVRDTATAEALLKAVGEDWNKIGQSILDAKVPLEDVKKQFQEAGVDITKIKSEFEGGFLPAEELDKFAADVRMVMTTMGLEGGEAAAKISQDWGISFSDAMKAVQATQSAIDAASGSASKMAETQMDNLAGSIEYFKSALSGAKIIISDQLTPSVREFVDFGTEGVQKLADAFQEGGLTGAMEAFGEILGDGLNMIIEKLPEFINGGIKLVEALGQGLMQNLPVITNAAITIIGQLGQSFVNNLPAVIDAGLTILEALLKAFSENIDKVLEAAKQLITGIGDAINNHSSEILTMGMFIVETLFNALVDNIPKIIEFATQMIVKLTEWIDQNADKLIDGAIAMIKAIADGLVKNLPTIIKVTVELIKTIVQALTDPTNLKMVLTAGIEVLMTLVDALANNLPELIPVMVEAILTIVETLIDNIDKVIDAALKIIIALADGLIAALPKLLEKAPEIITKLVMAIAENLPKIAEAGAEIIVKLAAAIIENLPAILNAAMEIMVSFATGIIEYIGKSIEAVGKLMDSIGETISNWDVIQWGKDMIDSFIEGIKDRISSVKDAVGDVAQAVKDVLGFSEPEEGPLSDFHTFAPDMMRLFAEGIYDNMGLVDDAIEDMASDIGNGLEISASPTYRVESAQNASDQDKLDSIIEMLSFYLPSYATAQDMENMTVSVNSREFGRLVREVG